MSTVLLLVPVLPLLTALIVVAGRGATVRNRIKIAVGPLGVAFCGAVAALYVVTTQGPITARFYDPDLAGSFPVPLGFYVDRLSAVMLVLISAIGTIIYVYSIEYMHGEPHERRYFTLLGIAVCVLLCMVTSANLLMLFLFWQILSYLLYLLIHNHIHAATLESAFRTFALLRTGDVAFLAGTALAYTLYGTLEFPELFSAASQSTATITLLPGIECNGTTAVTLLLLIGAMSKSAQFPFHIWLPRYLYAPTPVTALLHAGIINAGGFLINRLAPLFGLSSPALHAAFFIGTLTAVLGASMMLAQNDIKNMLGFSTIGQMGYMIMECGLGAFSLAVFHLIAHGLFKATVFLNCGDVIGKARLEPHFPHPEHESRREQLLAPDLGNRIRHDAAGAVADSSGHARRVAHSFARSTRRSDLSVLHLDHVLTGHLDAHASARSRIMESVGRDVADPFVRGVRVPVCGRVVHGVLVPQPARGRLLLQGGGAAEPFV